MKIYFEHKIDYSRKIGHARKIGYARASIGLEVEDQKQELKNFGCEAIFIEESTKPGKFSEESDAFTAVIDREPGDILVVTSLNRLGMSIKSFFTLLTELDRKKVRFISIKEDIDTGRDISTISLAHSLERMDLDLLNERTKRSLTLSKETFESGQKKRAGGRPSIPDDLFKYAESLIISGKSVREVAKIINVGQATVYRRLDIDSLKQRMKNSKT